jgi:geranyl-CoA carboxylase beta subunit
MVLRTVTEAKMKKAGAIDEAKLDAIEKGTREMLDGQTTALACTARMEDDGLIDPRDTRTILAFVLDVCREAEQRNTRTNTFGIGRF